MSELDRGKSKKIKADQEVKNMYKQVPRSIFLK